nr:hypothetical protein [Dyella sp. ASV24]
MAAIKGQRFIDISAVPYDPDRVPSEERALRTRAVSHAREMLGLKGFTLNAHDEALAQRFIDGVIDEAELMGKKYDIAPR